MKYYKTSNISIKNCNINTNIFINELLLDYLDVSKYYFYNEEYNNLRNNIVNNDYEKNKIKNNFFNKNNNENIMILRKSDNKIIKLPRLDYNNSLFNYLYFINLIRKQKEIFFFKDNDNNIDNFSTINSIIYLYFNI